MSNTDHIARSGSWAEQKKWAVDDSDADCLLELRARVERLEQAQQQPAPSTPAGQGELVGCVKKAMEAIPYEPGGYAPEARAAILAVANWFVSQGLKASADLLRREVRR